jgi:hypothetical protein
MRLEQRIDAFARVGAFIDRHYSGERNDDEVALHKGLDSLITTAHTYNNWFIPEFIQQAIRNIATWLRPSELNSFCAGRQTAKPQTVAVICAGNIPLVGFHDIMCVLLSGHKALIKLSSDDHVLLPFFMKLLVHYEPAFEGAFRYSEGKLTEFNAVIATGSNNTAAHFHYYFGKYPNIIRKSRTSAAVIKGDETDEELKALASDIFLYFGLGCRNVSKLLVPKAYDFARFFPNMLDYAFAVNNKKYGNNYDYNRAILLMEQVPFLDNNFMIVTESEKLHSPVSVVYYERIEDPSEVGRWIERNSAELQCVVGRDHLPFGYSQRPVITDFADNLDTLAFLVNL